MLKATDYAAPRAALFQSGPVLRAVAAHSCRLDVVAGNGWLAVGDAVATFDPLSAQGISFALESAGNAANGIELWLQGKQKEFPGYQHWVEQNYQAYLTTCREYYRVENRWPTEPFWQRQAITNVEAVELAPSQ